MLCVETHVRLSQCHRTSLQNGYRSSLFAYPEHPCPRVAVASSYAVTLGGENPTNNNRVATPLTRMPVGTVRCGQGNSLLRECRSLKTEDVTVGSPWWVIRDWEFTAGVVICHGLRDPCSHSASRN